MKKQFLEAGKIVNTHGVKGEVTVTSWCDSPEFLASFKRVFIDGREVAVLSARVHKNSVLMMLDGIEGVNDAMRLKEKVIMINRADVTLGEDKVFVQDLIGLPVFDTRLGREIGILESVDSMPAHDVYTISDGSKKYMVPAVRPFLEGIETDVRIRVRTIEGMIDED